MHGEVIGQIAGPAVVEVEEHGLAGLRSLRRDAGVDAVAVAMAARPGEAVERRDRGRQARCNCGQVFLRLRVRGIEREHRRDLAMQQVIEVEAVAPDTADEARRGVMDAGECHALRMGIGRRIEPRVRPSA